MTEQSDAPRSKSLPDLLHLGSNIIGRVVDLYVLTKLKRNEIHNDAGASFTLIERRKNRIRKSAFAKGESKLRDEIEWTLRFAKSPFGHHLPKVLDYSTASGDVHYTMRYYDFANLRTVIMLDMNADFFLKIRWRHLFHMFLNYMWTEENSAEPGDDFFEATHLRKYRERMEEARQMAPFLNDVLKWPSISINGRDHIAPDLIIDRVSDDKEFVSRLTPERVYISHGDIHTNNILCGLKAKRMIFLDCRGRAPDGREYFDVAYDIAKIYHDLRSYYSLIERRYFAVFMRIDDTGVECTFEVNQPELAERFYNNYRWVEEIIDASVTGYGNLRYRADFTEAMLYLTMVPLHLRNEPEGLVCLLTGICRLNEWLHRYHPDTFARLFEPVVGSAGLKDWENQP